MKHFIKLIVTTALVCTTFIFSDYSYAGRKRHYVAPVVNNTASLTWVAPPQPVSGYRVYYGTSPGNYTQPLGGGTYSKATSYTLIGLPAGYTYYFAVTAIDLAGIESGYSNEASKSIL
jgi:fibronectin type 3 domain-containing protein